MKNFNESIFKFIKFLLNKIYTEYLIIIYIIVLLLLFLKVIIIHIKKKI